MSEQVLRADAAIAEAAPAKLNLALHVRRRRADGYHDLETLFVFAADGDRVTVSTGPAAFQITGPFARGFEPCDDNLVIRAERAFAAAFGVATSHAIMLDKHLPVASGIGGGSADAAATLRALARLHGVAPDDARLFAIAAGLGADVPACLLGRASLGTGKGDALEPIAELGDVPALLVNPGVAVPTGRVFAAWDGVDRGGIAGGGSALDRAIAGRNDLQPAAEAVAPVIAEVIALLKRQAGVRFARMSGSGATCFALFDTIGDRDAAARDMAARHPEWWQLSTVIA
ncbi:4-(cytidine 5'-diphospho)-2-C-methyl-D-erythritol kinase [uncultured Sphingomonas sp.]|uniref:4-(cytidine 5'-diphospho)-2-C-methyl-D-erythritol kinase n=1 Tax=uncultured Sphingomonas sp. TaxID=158754 RepID=UPI00261BE43B|nr:4-(cytidine 5'-diphospho)-2-C-methyl-D-erythritol kinase [uncultured Sphingomonas sp.]